MVVENVKGAQPWVGRAKWHFGSFYLWGDVPALMPITFRGVMKPGVAHGSNGLKVPGVQFSGYGQPGYKAQGFNVTAAQRYWEEQGTKQGGDWFGPGEEMSMSRRFSSKSDSRKAASAAIAKIPFPLAQHIARCFKP